MIKLVRVDDRLIHGQVVVGWGQPLRAGFIVLVDDSVRASAWEQDIYRMGVPPQIEVIFASVAEAARQLKGWEQDARVGIVLTADVATLVALVEQGNGGVRRVNLGGIHHRPQRTERLRFLYLSDAEAEQLRGLAARGVEITAQDVPTARPVPLAELT
jgi:PTS system mannose-specific IIB component/fructoselysine and glucoselysine-specific PTS system IIB component